MKNGYQIHSDDTAPVGSRGLLGHALGHYGFIPNAIGAMAESPTVLEAYLTLDKMLGKTAFSEAERHVLMLAITREFVCGYCVAAHSAFAKMAGLPTDQVIRLREGMPLDDLRLERLHRFAAKMVATHGRVGDADVHASDLAQASMRNLNCYQAHESLRQERGSSDRVRDWDPYD